MNIDTSAWLDAAACRPGSEGNSAHDAVMRSTMPSQRMIAEAIEVCRGCDVVLPCMRAAKEQTYGVWAGRWAGPKKQAARPPADWVRYADVIQRAGLPSPQHAAWALKRARVLHPEETESFRTKRLINGKSSPELWVSPRCAGLLEALLLESTHRTVVDEVKQEIGKAHLKHGDNFRGSALTAVMWRS